MCRHLQSPPTPEYIFADPGSIGRYRAVVLFDEWSVFLKREELEVYKGKHWFPALPSNGNLIINGEICLEPFDDVLILPSDTVITSGGRVTGYLK